MVGLDSLTYLELARKNTESKCSQPIGIATIRKLLSLESGKKLPHIAALPRDSGQM
jgi:hypothetical protein